MPHRLCLWHRLIDREINSTVLYSFTHTFRERVDNSTRSFDFVDCWLLVILLAVSPLCFLGVRSVSPWEKFALAGNQRQLHRNGKPV